MKAEKSTTINRSVEDLYSSWRQLEDLPRFMNNLESVTVTGPTQSHWVAKGPIGMKLEWDAEITSDVPNQFIAWASLPGAQVENSGSVQFRPAPGDRGTEIRVSLEYSPPGGVVGATVAKLFGEEPEQQLHEDLRRFKQIMEAGEISTVEGQTSGRAKADKDGFVKEDKS